MELGHGLDELADGIGIDMRAVVSAALGRIQDVLHVPKTTMTIALGGIVVPEIGVGGGTDPRKATVTVSVDPKPRVGLREALVYRVRRTMAHELNHVKRMLDGPGCWSTSRTTLADALVCEGIADAFATQVYPDRKSPHDYALTAAQEERMWKKLRPKLDDPLKPEGFWKVFTSRGHGGIPHWTGYHIGFNIVGAYLRSHPGTTASSITLMDTEEIIAGSGYEGR